MVLPLLTGVALVVVGLVGWQTLADDPMNRSIRLSTGPPNGTYAALGSALGRVLEEAQVAGSVTTAPSAGSEENMARVGGAGSERQADFAFVQSDTPPREDVQLVATLYDEVLHILVARGKQADIASIDDLQDRRVSLGLQLSGTRTIAQRVLDYFGITLAEDLALAPGDIADAIRADAVDALFVLGALPSATVRELVEAELVSFLPLVGSGLSGSIAPALVAVLPSYQVVEIPRGIYGYGAAPAEPIGTVAVSALLVASREVDEDVVQAVTRVLFERRASMARDRDGVALALRIRESYEPAASMIPYHAGAVAYYQRREPAFLVEYAEAVSLIITLLVGVGSAVITGREWYRRRRKNRIDAYYNEVRHFSASLFNAPEEELRRARDALDEVRHRAFDDLVNEQVEADESFVIFQDYLRGELEAIDARLGPSHHEPRALAPRPHPPTSS